MNKLFFRLFTAFLAARLIADPATASGLSISSTGYPNHSLINTSFFADQALAADSQEVRLPLISNWRERKKEKVLRETQSSPPQNDVERSLSVAEKNTLTAVGWIKNDGRKSAQSVAPNVVSVISQIFDEPEPAPLIIETTFLENLLAWGIPETGWPVEFLEEFKSQLTSDYNYERRLMALQRALQQLNPQTVECWLPLSVLLDPLTERITQNKMQSQQMMRWLWGTVPSILVLWLLLVFNTGFDTGIPYLGLPFFALAAALPFALATGDYEKYKGTCALLVHYLSGKVETKNKSTLLLTPEVAEQLLFSWMAVQNPQTGINDLMSALEQVTRDFPLHPIYYEYFLREMFLRAIAHPHMSGRTALAMRAYLNRAAIPLHSTDPVNEGLRQFEQSFAQISLRMVDPNARDQESAPRAPSTGVRDPGEAAMLLHTVSGTHTPHELAATSLRDIAALIRDFPGNLARAEDPDAYETAFFNALIVRVELEMTQAFMLTGDLSEIIRAPGRTNFWRNTEHLHTFRLAVLDAARRFGTETETDIRNLWEENGASNQARNLLGSLFIMPSMSLGAAQKLAPTAAHEVYLRTVSHSGLYQELAIASGMTLLIFGHHIWQAHRVRQAKNKTKRTIKKVRTRNWFAVLSALLLLLSFSGRPVHAQKDLSDPSNPSSPYNYLNNPNNPFSIYNPDNWNYHSENKKELSGDEGGMQESQKNEDAEKQQTQEEQRWEEFQNKKNAIISLYKNRHYRQANRNINALTKIAQGAFSDHSYALGALVLLVNEGPQEVRERAFESLLKVAVTDHQWSNHITDHRDILDRLVVLAGGQSPDKAWRAAAVLASADVPENSVNRPFVEACLNAIQGREIALKSRPSKVQRDAASGAQDAIGNTVLATTHGTAAALQILIDPSTSKEIKRWLIKNLPTYANEKVIRQNAQARVLFASWLSTLDAQRTHEEAQRIQEQKDEKNRQDARKRSDDKNMREWIWGGVKSGLYTLIGIIFPIWLWHVIAKKRTGTGLFSIIVFLMLGTAALSSPTAKQRQILSMS